KMKAMWAICQTRDYDTLRKAAQKVSKKLQKECDVLDAKLTQQQQMISDGLLNINSSEDELCLRSLKIELDNVRIQKAPLLDDIAQISAEQMYLHSAGFELTNDRIELKKEKEVLEFMVATTSSC